MTGKQCRSWWDAKSCESHLNPPVNNLANLLRMLINFRIKGVTQQVQDQQKRKCLLIIWSVQTKMCLQTITKTHLFKYTENFTTKSCKFSDKNSDIFHISAQNIDCGYSLEPPRRGGSNVYPQSVFLSRKKKNNIYPCEPQFYYIKVGFKGVKII